MDDLVRALSGAGRPKSGRVSEVPAVWRGSVLRMLPDGRAWVLVPQLFGSENVGPLPVFGALLVDGAPCLVVSVSGSRDDLVVLSPSFDLSADEIVALIGLATASVDGLMSATDKSKLNAATSSPTADTLVRRDPIGAIQVFMPASGLNYATNRSYVDTAVGTKAALVHTHADATPSTPGFMSGLDKTKLDAATTANTPNTIVTRASNGRTNIGSIALATVPTNPDDATRKDYVDGHKWAGEDITSGTVPAARLPLVTTVANGAMLATDKVKLDAATVASTGNTIPLRDANGITRFGSVVFDSAQNTGANAATRKDYVDTAVATKAALVHTHSASDLTSGTLPDARLVGGYSMTTLRLTATADASETSTGHAFQIGADNTLNLIIDNNEIIGRNNGALSGINMPGGITVPPPTAGGYATRMDYVDGQVATRFPMNGDLGTANINTVNALGTHYTTASANIVPANGYPINGTSGALLVRPFNGAVPTSWVIQEWTQWSPLRKWARSSNNASAATPTWTPWIEESSARIAVGVASVASVATNAEVQVNVTFPAGLFSAAPNITATPLSPRINVGMQSLTTAGVTLRAFNWTTTASGASSIHWNATQP